MSDAQTIPTLEFKPDYAAAREHWLAFWQQELIDRPCCSITAPKDGVPGVPMPRYLSGAKGEFQPVVDRVVESAASVYWAGDAIPHYVPSFGPDQISAFLGAELVIPDDAEQYGTDWVLPCIEEWHDALPFALKVENPWWQRMLAFLRALREGCEGKLVLTHLDLHSNLDTLLAMRGGERLCMDFIDQPEWIDRAMDSVRAIFAPVYNGVYDAAGMAETGTLGWVPAYHPVKTNTIQCDFAALIGPEHFKRWALPALEEEAAFLGHCVYHLDGPECIVHLEDLCSIPHLDAIQWVHGARNKPFIEWMDLLKRIQALGKSVWVPCNAEDIKLYHRELDPTKVFYVGWASSEKQADEMLQWLVDNT